MDSDDVYNLFSFKPDPNLRAGFSSVQKHPYFDLAMAPQFGECDKGSQEFKFLELVNVMKCAPLTPELKHQFIWNILPDEFVSFTDERNNQSQHFMLQQPDTEFFIATYNGTRHFAEKMRDQQGQELLAEIDMVPHPYLLPADLSSGDVRRKACACIYTTSRAPSSKVKLDEVNQPKHQTSTYSGIDQLGTQQHQRRLEHNLESFLSDESIIKVVCSQKDGGLDFTQENVSVVVNMAQPIVSFVLILKTEGGQAAGEEAKTGVFLINIITNDGSEAISRSPPLKDLIGALSASSYREHFESLEQMPNLQSEAIDYELFPQLASWKQVNKQVLAIRREYFAKVKEATISYVTEMKKEAIHKMVQLKRELDQGAQKTIGDMVWQLWTPFLSFEGEDCKQKEVGLRENSICYSIWEKMGKPEIENFATAFLDEVLHRSREGEAKDSAGSYLVMIIARYIQKYLFGFLDRLETESVLLGFTDFSRAEIDRSLEQLTTSPEAFKEEAEKQGGPELYQKVKTMLGAKNPFAKKITNHLDQVLNDKGSNEQAHSLHDNLDGVIKGYLCSWAWNMKKAKADHPTHHDNFGLHSFTGLEGLQQVEYMSNEEKVAKLVELQESLNNL